MTELNESALPTMPFPPSFPRSAAFLIVSLVYSNLPPAFTPLSRPSLPSVFPLQCVDWLEARQTIQ